MTAAGLVEPEFVVHLFAPTDGPDAGAALAGVRALWENCRAQLGMTQPIVEVQLRADLPADLTEGPDGAVAGRQDPTVQFQAIARREHDVLNVSFAIAAPDAVPRSRTRLGSALPPGWHEFHRWWRTLGAGTGLLGGAVVLLAKSEDPAGVDLRTAVPAQEDDGDGWWEAGFALHGFAGWETTPAGTHGTRRLVLLAGLDEDAELSRFAWSDGGTALPPLGRYLMHAAKLRYQARVLGDGGQLARLRRRVTGRLDELTARLREPGGPGRAAAADLAGDRADLAATLQSLRVMRRTVDIARGNMAGILDGPLPADAPLGDWLAQQLVDDTDLLEAAWERAERVAAMLGAAGPAPEPQPAPAADPAPSPPPPAEVEHRVGFDVDVVNYSGRSTPRQFEVQRRVGGMIERILARVGVPVHETDRQPAGDGMMVVLPASVPADVALPALLHGWRAQVVADNAEHPHDRIRLRLSVGSGPFTRSAIGFSGQAIIEVGRLLDCQALRQAVLDHPDADLVAIVADRTYRDVVGEGYPGLRPEAFEPAEITIKTYQGRAWLWTGGAPAGPPRPDRHPVAASRDVFVIHGPGPQPRKDMFELLRALDLRPLGWEDMVTRTGRPAPRHDEILATAFAAGPGVLVVMAPGEEADVLIRAGRALALKPDHTIPVQVGAVAATELDRRQPVRLTRDTADASVVFQHEVAQRLRAVGYPVDTSGADWSDAERFRGLLRHPPDPRR
ncbi:CATRA conflict system CASPASE/TPR repeat-associated protein [Dactylosporangium siamense]|uniref:Uncharacterized protein n=1 Tax=Dactylosporangium siamense TaxID=685454 RepID=A0A919PHE5_9ACTN|nr:CATRA conflict system CASPASE/TPR repeat-associated protein [Dactylosporangium siamense]GIG42620.1 hypothetical protein Dsi01nite_006610 [Dactylosporangium siamense]